MALCRVFGCGNYRGKSGLSPFIRFYNFPRDPVRFEEWALAGHCGKLDPKVTNVMCGVHFAPEAMLLKDRLLKKPLHQCRLSPTAAPTLRLRPENGAGPIDPPTERQMRHVTRKRRFEVRELLQDNEDGSTKRHVAEKTKAVAELSISTQTDETLVLMHFCDYIVD